MNYESISSSSASGAVPNAVEQGGSDHGGGVGHQELLCSMQQQQQQKSLQKQNNSLYATMTAATFPASSSSGGYVFQGRRFTTTITAVETAGAGGDKKSHDRAAATATILLHHPHHQPPLEQQHELKQQQDELQQNNKLHEPHQLQHPAEHRQQHQAEQHHQQARSRFDYTSLGCGLLAGVAQAGLLNPYDRALFLSVTHHRPFLAVENWQAPYTGFVQSMSGRALQGGLYFPLEQFFLSMLANDSSPSTSSSTTEQHNTRLHFLAGTAAGAVNALILNPLSAFKYKTWGRPPVVAAADATKQTSGSMWTRAQRHLQAIQRRGSGGTIISPCFWNGLAPTLYRDVVFGGCYTCLRWQIREYYMHSSSSSETHNPRPAATATATATWYANLMAAALATILSGPFNYARNIQYASRGEQRPLSTMAILQNLVHETRHHAQPGRFLQNRLQLGWGTARVAFGISLGHGIYDWLLVQAHDAHHEQQ